MSDEGVVEVQGDVLDNVLDEDDIDDVLDEEVEEVEPNVWDNVLDDDIDDDMIGNDDIDDDVDMAYPYNINSEVDDAYVELDEEEDWRYWNFEMYEVCIYMFSVDLFSFIYLKFLFS